MRASEVSGVRGVRLPGIAPTPPRGGPCASGSRTRRADASDTEDLAPRSPAPSSPAEGPGAHGEGVRRTWPPRDPLRETGSRIGCDRPGLDFETCQATLKIASAGVGTVSLEPTEPSAKCQSCVPGRPASDTLVTAPGSLGACRAALSSLTPVPKLFSCHPRAVLRVTGRGGGLSGQPPRGQTGAC